MQTMLISKRIHIVSSSSNRIFLLFSISAVENLQKRFKTLQYTFISKEYCLHVVYTKIKNLMFSDVFQHFH